MNLDDEEMSMGQRQARASGVQKSIGQRQAQASGRPVTGADQARGFGPVYDSPGGSGGDYMMPMTYGADGPRRAALGEPVFGWVRNPDYNAGKQRS